MERNLKLIIAYDGTEFHGWQTQSGVRTVQADLERVLMHVLRQPIALTGASRTDAGVHARGQVANLRIDSPVPTINLYRAASHRVPADMAIVHVSEVPLEFNATRDALGKLYRYAIHNTHRAPPEDAAGRACWHYWNALDLERMRVAARALVGTHDFAAFQNKGSARESTVRTIRRVDIQQRYHRVTIDVEGDGFLYNQVRIIAGTLLEVGRGHWPPQRVAEALKSGDRGKTGPTAPPQGLTLQWVRYASTRSANNGA